MTAIVGFMNKRGVAIAADSAVTFGNTHKVVNTGNKIFTLSKHSPVGVATFGSADFMGTPWEIIIKLYRKQLGRKKYNSLDEYIKSFLEYLHQNDFFSSEDVGKRILRDRALDFYNICVSRIEKRDDYTHDKEKIMERELETCYQLNVQDAANHFEEMKKCNKEEFDTYFQNELPEILSAMPLLVNNKKMQQIFVSAFYQYLVTYIPYRSDSGLVFFGYGENEIYPRMVNIMIADSFCSYLRYKRIDGSSGAVTINGSTAWIIPYAQVDVSQTIIRGINPAFLDVLHASMHSILDGYRQKLLTMIPLGSENKGVIDAISAINHSEIAQNFVNNATEQFMMHYTEPLINTVAELSKEDMANLAESLVELTSLVRRMSPAEETVGGPVDVAVVSKGDGFIWLKRKHYFDPKLNTNFINTYNDEE